MMFSSLSALFSSTGPSSASNTTRKIFRAVRSQGVEKKVPLTSKEEVEKRLVSILAQIQQNQVKRLNLTSISLGRFYELANTLKMHESMVYSLVVLKNGTLASGSGNPKHAIKIWDLTSHSCLATLRGHTDTILTLAALPNGQLVSGSMDSTIKLWDLSSRSCLTTLREHTYPVDALAVLPCDQLASGSRDCTIKIWGLTSHACLATLQGHTNAIYALVALPNGRLASGSRDNAVKLWDLSSRSCLATLHGHTYPVDALAVLPNGQLASGSMDKTIRLWDLTSHTCLATLQGHTDAVWSLAILPNGQLASSSFDKTIKLWDLATHTCLSTLRRHTSSVNALAVLPNGQLASGSDDTTIRFWESKTLSAKQLSHILDALKNNISVTALDLSGNRDILDELLHPLMPIFAQNASSGLKPNSSLKTIDLRSTGVSKKGVRSLEKVIQHQRLSIEVLADCPIEWMMIYFLIIFCRANRNSPFADSGLELCKYGEVGPFLGIPSGFFARHRKNLSSQYAALSPS